MLSANLTAILERAVDDARARRHAQLTVEHLLLAILTDAEGARIVPAHIVDLRPVRADLERHLGSRPGLAPPGAELGQTDEFQRTLQRGAMHATAVKEPELTTAHVLVAILAERDAYATFLLVRAGLTRLVLTTHLCHGAPEAARPAALPQVRLLGGWRPRWRAAAPVPAESAVPDLYAVVLHDDEYTTREFVVDMLASVFQRSPTDAHALMEEVQRNGTGRIGPYSLQDATALLEEATRRARAAEHPLKLTLVAATGT